MCLFLVYLKRQQSVQEFSPLCFFGNIFDSFGDGDDDGDSVAEADSAGSDGSDSDSSVTITGRGRSSAPDRRRLGSGSGVKREKREPVPVSPPRQSIIAAAHEAEVGSQIKVKFDTGHWFGGTILEVDSQRWVHSVCVCGYSCFVLVGVACG